MQEISIDYTRCLKEAPNSTDYVAIPNKYTSSSFKGSNSNCTTEPKYLWRQNNTTVTYSVGTKPVDTQVCSLQFNIPDNLDPPVLFYYRLTNFYQNHRRYVKSLDSNQLRGDAVSNNSLGSCDPLETDPSGKPYYPCGLIANSLFNDSFSNPVQLNPHYSSASNITYNMTDSGISWGSDRVLYGRTKYNYADIAVPPNWYLQWQNGYSDENPPLDLDNAEAFQVWMRTAGLPNFSKLAKRNDNETMECSMYQVDIRNSQSNLPPRPFLLCLLLLTTYAARLPCGRLWRHQIYGDIDSNCRGREEPLPRHRICGSRRHLHCSGHSVHDNASHQASVWVT